jgi:HD superfamily phosphodiesterase
MKKEDKAKGVDSEISNNLVAQTLLAMLAYFGRDARRVNHLLKVYGFARAIGAGERLDARTQEILEVAALTHDIGIRRSEEKYGSATGTYQQIEGPPEAEKMLRALGADEALTRRVCWLIAHHHTYAGIEAQDHQILVEADFLVNAFEDGLDADAIGAFATKIFRTETGGQILRELYLQNADETL